MQSGDMSRQAGGVFIMVPENRAHAEHQNGLDVDVRYMRLAGEGPLNLANPLERYNNYDQESTLELLQCFLNNQHVVSILYDTLTQIFNGQGETRLQHASGHSDHFHVRIGDPDGRN
jgi:murein endopeptidase